MSTAQQTQQVTEHVEELRTYWPALAGALDRDQGSAAAGPAAGSAPMLTAPVNLDVLRATTVLATEVPSMAAWCCGVVGEQHTVRDVAGELPHFPRWAERMLATAAVREAGRLAYTVHGWRDMAKAALGLLVGDRPLGQHCPHHDEPLVELVAPGDEGWLHHRPGEPGPTISWVHVHAVACRHCGTRWIPSQYLWLGRLIRHANQRRTQARVQPSAA